jgi:hypothetical protein
MPVPCAVRRHPVAWTADEDGNQRDGSEQYAVQDPCVRRGLLDLADLHDGRRCQGRRDHRCGSRAAGIRTTRTLIELCFTAGSVGHIRLPDRHPNEWVTNPNGRRWPKFAGTGTQRGWTGAPRPWRKAGRARSLPPPRGPWEVRRPWCRCCRDAAARRPLWLPAPISEGAAAERAAMRWDASGIASQTDRPLTAQPPDPPSRPSRPADVARSLRVQRARADGRRRV